METIFCDMCDYEYTQTDLEYNGGCPECGCSPDTDDEEIDE